MELSRGPGWESSGWGRLSHAPSRSQIGFKGGGSPTCFTEDKSTTAAPPSYTHTEGHRREHSIFTIREATAQETQGLSQDRWFVVVLDQPLPSSKAAPGAVETRVWSCPPNTSVLLWCWTGSGEELAGAHGRCSSWGGSSAPARGGRGSCPREPPALPQ